MVNQFEGRRQFLAEETEHVGNMDGVLKKRTAPNGEHAARLAKSRFHYLWGDARSGLPFVDDGQRARTRENQCKQTTHREKEDHSNDRSSPDPDSGHGLSW